VNFNDHKIRTGEISSANGHANAKSMAKIAAAMSMGGIIDGIQLLDEKAHKLC